MRIFHQMLPLTVGLLFFLTGCNRQVEPSNAVEQRYKHDLFSSEAECRQLNPNYEISCSETIRLSPSGQADVLLGGGDVIVRSTYTQQGNTIRVKASDGLPKDIIFTIVSKTELVRIDNGTKWQSY